MLGLGQSSAPYGNCGLAQTASVSNSWTQFTFPFQVSGKNCGPANNRLSIQAGKVAGKLWIAKISLSEGQLSISPGNEKVLASGGSGEIRVTSSAGMEWAVNGAPDWIQIRGAKSGNGNGIVHYTVLENVSNSPRSATIHIGDVSFQVDQPHSAYINVPFVENFNPPPAQWAPQPPGAPSTINHWGLLDLTNPRTNVTVTAEGPEGANSVVLDKPRGSTASWSTQLYLSGLKTTRGADYRVSLWLKAQHPGLAWLAFGQASEPYHSCGLSERIWVSGIWSEYKVTFRAEGERCGPENNRFALLAGGISGKLWVARTAIERESPVEIAAAKRH